MAPEEKNEAPVPVLVPKDVVEQDDDEEDNEEGWEDAEPDHEEETPVICLFCPEAFLALAKVFEHCRSAHGFDFGKTRKEFSKVSSANCMKELLLIELF